MYGLNEISTGTTLMGGDGDREVQSYVCTEHIETIVGAATTGECSPSTATVPHSV